MTLKETLTRDEWLAYRKAVNKRYRDRNKEKINASRREVYQCGGRDAELKSWAENNPDKVREYKVTWKKNNPHKVALQSRIRRGVKAQATPVWANDELEQLILFEVYELARLRTEVTGIEWHVDHEVPLTSKLVCGLHCAANLQVIPAKVNLSKHNRTWKDMPNASS